MICTQPEGVLTALSPSMPTLMIKRSPAMRPAGFATETEVAELPPDPLLDEECQTAWASARPRQKHPVASNAKTACLTGDLQERMAWLIHSRRVKFW